MKKIGGGGLLLAAAAALAQEDAVVITATRVPQPSLEVPASVDRIYADEIRQGRPQVNLSESLGRVPGIVVQNRQNYAQDLQISSRGFGARATFGVRGIRLIADGIPATMPDGQGQASTFALGSAERIEVLRGPFSSLYGNSAGGVIVVETEDPPQAPTVGVDLFGGSYDTWRAAVKLGGYNTLLDASRFESDGYRDHSAVRRDHYNLKFKYGFRPDTSLTIVGNQLRQPDTQDPLGLTRAQFEQNPEQATPQAIQFDTRKTIYQEQLGATLAHRLGGGSRIEGTVYGGSRWVEQYLAIPLAAQVAPTSSGGVVQLDRGYAGAALRLSHQTGTVILSAGAEYDRMEERRRGFVNNLGIAGALKRDEDDKVSSTDFYAQAEWRFAERWSVHGGVRTSRVEFRSEDHFVVPGNPDDSGTRKYSETTPVAGLLFRYSKTMSFYGSYGEGFETPTFAELAHQNPPATGLNFALEASRSKHAEIGAKTILPNLARINFALFAIETRDEIVVDTSSGGRTTFKNAGRTERQGFELGADTLLRRPFGAQLAYTYLDATFEEGFAIPAGNALPGVPKTQAYAQLYYRQPRFYTYLEALYRARVPVNDANSEFADAYSVFNLVGALVQQGPGWRISEYVRLDNLADRNYIGSVIVNEANGRFYEPAPRRNISAGIQASLQF
ncbi:MAG TPA: TonB-dependent receptor [Burkholderiales bacterium]|jgi:iron complex outermembrane receptor protein|nr:TonB-dependent receptor [Burkholderiales bacterium]